MDPRTAPPLITFLCAALFLAAFAGCADGPSDEDPVRVIVSMVPSPATPGGTATLLWRFEIAPDWHLYWHGRNDSGYPPQIEWTAPPGWTAGDLQWPVPERHVMDGEILDHVYYRELVLLQDVRIPVDAEPGQVARTAKVSWLACREACVPGRTEVAFTLPVAAEAGGGDPALAAARANLPQPAPEGLLNTRWEGSVFHLAAAGAARLTFMPAGDCGPLADLLRQGRANPLALEFRPKEGAVGPVRGLIVLEPETGPVRTYSIDLPASAVADAFPGG